MLFSPNRPVLVKRESDPYKEAAVVDSPRQPENTPSQRREFHGMRYQLVDEATQLNFAAHLNNPVFRAIHEIESNQSVTGLTFDALEAVRGSPEHDLLIDAVERMSIGFILFDPHDRLVLCNGRYRDLYPHIAHLLVPGEHYADIARAVAAFADAATHPIRTDGWMRSGTARADDGAYEVRLRGGTWLEAQDMRTANGGRVGIRTDITARKSAEHRQILETRSLQGTIEDLGTIAVEMRKVLDLAGGKLIDLARHLETTRETDGLALTGELERCKIHLDELSHRLVALSGIENRIASRNNLNDIIRRIEPVLSLAIGDRVNLKHRTDNRVWDSLVDAETAGDAVLHVATRAHEVMPAGGTLVINTANVNLIAPYRDQPDSEHVGPHVLVTLTFSGAERGSEDAEYLLVNAIDIGAEPTEVIDEALESVRTLMRDCGGFLRVSTAGRGGVTVELGFPAYFDTRA
jgi:PAS domain-containing protein